MNFVACFEFVLCEFQILHVHVEPSKHFCIRLLFVEHLGGDVRLPCFVVLTVVLDTFNTGTFLR